MWGLYHAIVSDVGDEADEKLMAQMRANKKVFDVYLAWLDWAIEQGEKEMDKG